MPDERNFSEVLDALRGKEYQEILTLGEKHPEAVEYDVLMERRDELIAESPEAAASVLEFILRNSHDQKLLYAATEALVMLVRQPGQVGKAIELNGIAMQKVEGGSAYQVLETAYGSALFHPDGEPQGDG